MKERVFFAANQEGALGFAAAELEKMGQRVVPTPSDEVTHLLLPVPALDAQGHIQGGGELPELLAALPPSIKVIGGNLATLHAFECWDLLSDEGYLAKNAVISAHCALMVGMQELNVTLKGCPVLVIGWGRIGEALAGLLTAVGADVTVATRSPARRAMLTALGYGAEDPAALRHILGRYRLIYNTAPAPILSEAQTALCRADCVKIDLASTPGILEKNVIYARGLPGKYAPESSGKLIAGTILRLCAQKEGII